MYRDVISRMEGIDILPLLGLFIFIALFIGMLIWVFRLSKNYIKTVSNMPLDDDNGKYDDTTDPENSSRTASSDQSNKRNME